MVEARPPASRTQRLAAIDCGTNSFHLVVADVKPSGKFTVLSRDKEVVRLGEAINDMKHLKEEAMDRALATLRRFVLIARSFNAEIRAVATSAIREANNREALLARVRDELGLTIEVVSGFEEARLIYLGAMQALPLWDKNTILFDIGGGSTEFLHGAPHGAVRYAHSFKVGAVRLTRRFFSSEPYRDRDILECRRFLAGELEPMRRALLGMPCDIVVGCSGTVLSVASMAAGRTNGAEDDAPEGGILLTRAGLDTVVRQILEARTSRQRNRIPGLDPQRVDIITAGVLILEQIFVQLKLDAVMTSRYALREGVLLDTIQKKAGQERSTPHLRDIRRTSVDHLLGLCRADLSHARQVTRLSLSLFDQCVSVHGLGMAEREFLEAASQLHDIGYHISHAQHHRHSYYLIRNAELMGFTDREIEIIANVARYHRKSHPKAKHEAYMRLGDGDRAIVRRLAAILRVADGLDRRHQSLVKSIRCRIDDARLTLELQPSRPTADCSIEIWGAERRRDLFELEFSRSLTILREP